MRVAELLAIDLNAALKPRGEHATYIDNGHGEWICVRLTAGVFETRWKPNEAAVMLRDINANCHDYAKLLEQEKS